MRLRWQGLSWLRLCKIRLWLKLYVVKSTPLHYPKTVLSTNGVKFLARAFQLPKTSSLTNRRKSRKSIVECNFPVLFQKKAVSSPGEAMNKANLAITIKRTFISQSRSWLFMMNALQGYLVVSTISLLWQRKTSFMLGVNPSMETVELESSKILSWYPKKWCLISRAMIR